MALLSAPLMTSEFSLFNSSFWHLPGCSHQENGLLLIYKSCLLPKEASCPASGQDLAQAQVVDISTAHLSQ